MKLSNFIKGHTRSNKREILFWGSMNSYFIKKVLPKFNVHPGIILIGLTDKSLFLIYVIWYEMYMVGGVTDFWGEIKKWGETCLTRCRIIL